MLEEIKKTAAFIQAEARNFAPEVGIVLGTGLGDFADRIDTQFAIEYKQIPGFPVSTVEGHKGRMIFGTVEGPDPFTSVAFVPLFPSCSIS